MTDKENRNTKERREESIRGHIGEIGITKEVDKLKLKYVHQ